MADRPIIFSAPMIKALIEKRKTQTRRLLKLPTKGHDGTPIYETPAMGGWEASTIGGKGCYVDSKLTIPAIERACVWHRTCGTVVVPRYDIGDQLWVQEAHYLTDDGDEECVVYAEDQDAVDGHLAGVRNMQWQYGLTEAWAKSHLRQRATFHMPRWASRLTLTVTEVRVQRLQEISAADSIAEGVECETCLAMGQSACHGRGCFASIGAYAILWNILHAKPKPVKGPDGKVASYVSYPWDGEPEKRVLSGKPWIINPNPWVTAQTFTVALQNIDALPQPKD